MSELLGYVVFYVGLLGRKGSFSTDLAMSFWYVFVLFDLVMFSPFPLHHTKNEYEMLDMNKKETILRNLNSNSEE